jgi:hypothetical protein
MHHTLNTSSWRGSQLKKHRDNFTFYLYLYRDVLKVKPETGTRHEDLGVDGKIILEWILGK